MIEKTEENIKYYEKLFNENLMFHGCGYYGICCTHDCPCNLSVSMEEMTYNFDRYNEVRTSLEEEREEMIKEYSNYDFDLDDFLDLDL